MEPTYLRVYSLVFEFDKHIINLLITIQVILTRLPPLLL